MIRTNGAIVTESYQLYPALSRRGGCSQIKDQSKHMPTGDHIVNPSQVDEIWLPSRRSPA